MADDYDSFLQMINDRRANSLDSRSSISLPKDNSSKAKILKEILAVIEREEESIVRQDMITYKFNFNCMTQALSVILGIVMIINSLIFITTSESYGRAYILSMIMFGQAGVMFVLSALMVSKRTMTMPKRFRYKEINPIKRDLRYAFAHSFTWFLAALCMAIFSTIYYFQF